MAAVIYKDMLVMLQEEKELRRKLLDLVKTRHLKLYRCVVLHYYSKKKIATDLKQNLKWFVLV